MSLLGRAALLLALCAAVYALVMALGSRRGGRRAWQESAERGVYAVFALTTLAIATMWAGLLTDAFELRNVAEYTSSTLGAQYKITALWGSQAGSLLLWAWIFSGFSSLAVYTNRARNRELMPVVVAVLMVIALFFLGLLSFVTSPFETLATVPAEGRGLNPLLQNFYMQIHPPLLYLGYVGLSIPFAFAIAALVTRKLDTGWIQSIRRWTIFSWLFLGIGILLGAKWAYETLGWGGYWAWDPVENAAFMPWLVATAFLHSVMVQERRGMLKVWNMVLVILTFSLCLFGTFLTRSGIISSVHAFGESTLGPFFLAFIIAVLVGSLALLVTRLPLLRSQHTLESYLSREAIFLANNLLLVGLAFAVFWGTMFPILSEAVRGDRITVGQGYYDQVALPIGAALLVLTGVGPADRLAQGQPRPAAAALCGAAGGGGHRRRAPAPADRPRRELDRVARRDRGGLRHDLHRRRGVARPARAPCPWERLVAGGVRQHGRPQPAPLRRLCGPSGHRGAVHRPGRLQGLCHRGGRHGARGRPGRGGRLHAPQRGRRQRRGCPQVARERPDGGLPRRPAGDDHEPGPGHLRRRRHRGGRGGDRLGADARPVHGAHPAEGRRHRQRVGVRQPAGALAVGGGGDHRLGGPDRGLARPAVCRGASLPPARPPRPAAARGRERAPAVLAGALILAAVALALVVVLAWPLVARRDESVPADPGADARRALEEDLARSLGAIREIEMDHRAGNLSDEDFAELDRAERARAVELMRRRDALR